LDAVVGGRKFVTGWIAVDGAAHFLLDGGELLRLSCTANGIEWAYTTQPSASQVAGVPRA
jgi:hypothetical protein